MTMDAQALQMAARLAETVEARDPFTKGHARAVSAAAVAIGQELHMPETQLMLLEAAGLLHDIGYIEISATILTKPGRLTLDEFEQIQSHPVIGAEIVRAIPSLREAADAIEYHHERCDGTGYPKGAKKADTPLEGRILAVAETYDAITAHRAHRTAFAPVKAIRGLKTAARTQLDQELVDALLASLTRVSGEGEIETLSELPLLDVAIWHEQRKLRETYVGISTCMMKIMDWVLGKYTREVFEREINEILHRVGVPLTLMQEEVEDRLPSRLPPSEMAREYRTALAQQIMEIEKWLGSRLTRYYLGMIINQFGPDVKEVCARYQLCEVPEYTKTPLRVSDNPLVLTR